MENTNVKLNNVLEENKGKYIKLGGKAGFFFCGYIRDNYKDLMDDIIDIEEKRLERLIENSEISIKNADVYWNTKALKLNIKDPKIISIKKKEYINSLLNRIKDLQSRKEKMCDLLNNTVTDVYHSTIDSSTIIIIDSKIIGTIYDRKDMISKPLYRNIRNKYRI